MSKVECPYAKGRSGCRCPRAYSRCVAWVRADFARGDLSRGHGGWGWPEAGTEWIARKAQYVGTSANLSIERRPDG